MLKKNKKSEFVLVLSGGGTRGLFACGVLKALEELGIKEQISAIYGVSAGALLGAYWSSGWKAEDILQRFLDTEVFGFKNLALPPKFSLLKNNHIQDILKTDIKKKFNKLDIPFYIAATDILTAKLILFSKGEVIPPLLGSMALPGIFPPVEHKKYLLVDGGVINNFPVLEAKNRYPNALIIGILLNKFKKNQKITNLFDNLLVCYNILLKANLSEEANSVDYLFAEELDMGTLESSKKRIKEIYQIGHQRGFELFSSYSS